MENFYIKTVGRQVLCENCNRYYNKRSNSCYFCRTKKPCKQCKEVKLLEDFYKSKTSGDGHLYICKICDNERRKSLKQAIKNNTIDLRIKTQGRSSYCDSCKQYYNSRALNCPYCRTEKQCHLCKITKSLDQFYLKSDQIDGRFGDCIQCYREVIHYNKTYGLTKEQIFTLRKDSNGCCAICKKETKLHLDHDHLTSLVRGFLCQACNKGLGMFEDNIELLAAAITYLERDLI